MYIDVAKQVYQWFFGPAALYSFLKNHFGKAPDNYPIVEASFPRYRHPCLALALSQYMKMPGVSVKVIGTRTEDTNISLSYLMHPNKRDSQLEGPLKSSDITLANDKNMSYASQGLYLIKCPAGKLAVWISRGGEWDEEVVIEVISKERKTSRKFIADIRRLTDERSIYKGKVISLQGHDYYGPRVNFQNTRRVERKQLILPDSVLEEIDRHTSLFSKHHQRLKNSRMHLKRGLLLFGPPGSGKTSTMLHIVSSMPDRTTVFVSARNSELLESACELARDLQPATIIIDDVDLVAGDRHSPGNNNEALADLLNQMDGISDDSDVLFLLSTNCPEALEPALAARPGRIDQAICIPLPDADCRRKLFELYGQSMNVKLGDPERLIEATEGASGAFIKELFRKALLLAAERGEEELVDDEILERALSTIKNGSPMMRKLLAYKATPPAQLDVAV